MAGGTQSWVHAADPLAALSIDKKVQSFLKRYEQGSFFEHLLDKYVLGPQAEPHLLFVMKPDSQHNARLKEAESVFLQSPNLPQIESDSARLKEKQSKPGDLSVLPCLQLSDVPTELKHPAILPASPTNPLFFHNRTPESNGLVHFKALLPLPLQSLSEREIKLIPLLLQSIAELGGRQRASAADFDCAVRASTGGLSFACQEGFVQSPGEASLSLLASSFALESNASKMFALLQEALVEPNLLGDLDRLRTILASTSSSLNNSIASSGNRFAALRAASLFGTKDSLLSEWLGGLSQAEFLDSLYKEDSIASLAQELEELRQKLLSQSSSLRTFLVSSPSSDHALFEQIESFKRSLPVDLDDINQSNSASNQPSSVDHQFYPGPFNSNFSALSLQLPSTSTIAPGLQATLSLSARLLRSKFLHREIRERGGAYGSSASFSPLQSRFTFSSFRDPQPQRSLQIFRESLKALQPGSADAPTEQDLLGAKLAVFAELEAPVPVAARGLGVFKYGALMGGDERRRQVREALRRCTLKDIEQCLQTLSTAPQRTCIIGTE